MKVCIFGAGQGGRMAECLCSPRQEMLCYIDNNPGLWGKKIDGKSVLPLDAALENNPDEIWIAVLNKDAENQIEKQILDAGFEGKICRISDIRSRIDTRVASLRLYAGEIYRRNIPGAIAELGVYKGDFARELSILFPERRLYLFDTFEGFAGQDVKTESECHYSRAKTGDFSDTSVEAVRSRMINPDRVIIRKGYFPDTTADLPEETFAFVNIDPDLYEPTLAGLRYFYPRMEKGGCIFIHDFTSYQFTGVRKAVEKFCEEEGVYVFPLTDLHGTGVLMK